MKSTISEMSKRVDPSHMQIIPNSLRENLSMESPVYSQSKVELRRNVGDGLDDEKYEELMIGF